MSTPFQHHPFSSDTQEAPLSTAQRLQALIETSGDVLGLFDRHLNVLYLNPAVEQMLGYPLHDYVQRADRFSLLHSADRQQSIEQVTHILDSPGSSSTIRHRVQHQDGTFRWIEVTLTNRLDDPHVAALVAESRDITQRVQAEAKVKDVQANLAMTFDNVPSGIYLYDQVGNILMANALGARLLGFDSVEELLQEKNLTLMRKRFYDHYTVVDEDGNSFPPAQGPVGRALQEQRDIQLICRYSHIQRQEHFWALARATPVFDEQGTLTNVIYSITDITRQKEAEATLRQREHILTLALKAGKMGTWQFDLLQETALHSFEHDQIFGYQTPVPAWNYGLFLQHVVAADRERVEEQFQQAYRTGELRLECRIRRADTSQAWIHVRGQVFYQTNRSPRALAGIVMDITQRKYEEEQLEQQKNDIISIASHELKTPITALHGFTELLIRLCTKQGIHEPLASLSRMGQQIEKMTRLINKLLEVSRLGSGKVEYVQEPLDIAAVVKESIDIIQQSSPRHTIALQGTAPFQIVGDKDRLGQVFANLLTNAVKYSPNAQHIDVSMHAAQDQVIIHVRDYGIGIAREYQSKIFDRFYRASVKHLGVSGLGMGLYISSEIVKQHGGTLSVLSEEGKGSTFSVMLPLGQGK